MKHSLLKFCWLLLYGFLWSNQIQAQQMKYHRIEAKINQATFQQLMEAGLDIDHYHYHDSHLIAEVSDRDLEIFKTYHVRVNYLINDISRNILKHNAKIDKENARAKKTRAVTVPTPVHFGTGGNYGVSGAVTRHFTFQDMQNELDEMRTAYPNLISIKSGIGTTLEGRTIFMVRLSDNPDINENEPEVLLNAVHHAREPMSMTQLIFFMWHLLENYNSDKEIQTLVNSTELYIVPCLNPDGYVYNQTTNTAGGGMWRKNRRNNGNGTFGVDDNRNYAYGWGGSGSSSSGSSETYRGTAPFSEYETQAIRDLCNTHTFITGFNYHSYGNYCIYPYSYVSVNNNPEIPLFTTLANFLTTDNAFVSGNAQATVNYVASGGAEDWSYGEQISKPKMYSFTLEVRTSTDGFWPAASRIIPLCNSMIVMNKNLMKLSTAFAEVTPSAPPTLSSLNGSVPFNIKSYGIVASTYTVTLNPLSSSVSSVDPAKVFNSMTIFQTINDVFNYTLDPSVTSGTNVEFEVITDNGMHIRKDSITIQYVCPSPVNTSTNAITLSTADLSWNALSGTTDYYISYKESTSSTWGADILVSATNTTLNGLAPNTAYQWKVRASGCNLYSSVQNFSTLPPCGTPSPNASSIGSGSATIAWPAVGTAASYTLDSRVQGTSTWNSTTLSSTSYTLNSLLASTTYEYRVSATCPSETSAYSAIQTFSTQAPGPVYCTCNGNTNSSEWIDYIQFGAINRVSGAESGGYLHSGLSTNLIKGTSTTLTFSAGFPLTVLREYWRVYIDYNKDGDFNDSGESEYNSKKTGSGNYTVNISVPNSALLGTTRMRIIMSRSSISSSCGSFVNGEVEDYTVNITSSFFKTENEIKATSVEELHVRIIPNPFNDMLQVDILELNRMHNAHIKLMNMHGEVVYKLSLKEDDSSVRINTSALGSGIYFLLVQKGDRRKVIKMIK